MIPEPGFREAEEDQFVPDAGDYLRIDEESRGGSSYVPDWDGEEVELRHGQHYDDDTG